MRAYDHSLRLQAIELYKKGEKKVKISQKLEVSYYTILKWIKSYEQEGERGLKLKYSNCGASDKISQRLKREAIELKKEHPGWGSDYIRMKLQNKYPDAWLPSARQFRRYFEAAGVNQVQTSKLPKARGENSWSKEEFYRVQVDAKEQIQTKDGNWSSYLTFTDEKSGAVLDAFVFPPQVYPSGST